MGRIEYKQIETRISSPRMYKHEPNKNAQPEWLGLKFQATKDASPTTYKSDVSKDNMRAKNDFRINKGKRESFTTFTTRTKAFVPGAGSYDLKNINKGFDITTRGAAR